MLTARDTIDDRVAGLDAGADDYLVKPFALASCWRACARCCAASRRRRSACASPTSRSTRSSREVRRGDRRIDLTRTEFGLLELSSASAPGADARADLRARLGLRLRRRPPTPSASTSGTCAARPRRPASRACCTRCAAWATCCASSRDPAPALMLWPPLAVGVDGRAGVARRYLACAASCAAGRPPGCARRASSCSASAPCATARRPRHRAAPAGPAEFSQVVGPDGVARDRQGGAGGSGWSAAIGRAAGGGPRRPVPHRPHRRRRPPPRHHRADLGPRRRSSSGARWRGSTPSSGACGSCSSCSCSSARRSPPCSARLFARPVIRPIAELTRGGRAHRGHRRPRAPHRRRAARTRSAGMAQRFDAMLDRVQALAGRASASSWPTPRTSCARR